MKKTNLFLIFIFVCFLVGFKSGCGDVINKTYPIPYIHVKYIAETNCDRCAVEFLDFKNEKIYDWLYNMDIDFPWENQFICPANQLLYCKAYNFSKDPIEKLYCKISIYVCVDEEWILLKTNNLFVGEGENKEEVISCATYEF